MEQLNGRGKTIAGVAGIVLFLDMFLLSWFGVSGYGGDVFETTKDWVGIILMLACFAAFALALFDDMTQIDTPLSVIATGLGAIAAVVILFEIITGPSIEGTDLSSKFGAWLGLIAAIGIAVGGYVTMSEEGVTFTE